MASEGRHYVKPSQVAKELMNSSLLFKWQQFAVEIGVPSTDIELKRADFSRGNIPAADLFTDLLTLRCAYDEFPISVVHNALEEMELLGIAGDLKESFPENKYTQVYISNNPKRHKKPEVDSGKNQRTPVGAHSGGGTPLPSVLPEKLDTTSTPDFIQNDKPLEVKVKLCDALIERPVTEAYPMTSTPRGGALIMNNIKFDEERTGLKTRHGAQNDTIYLRNLLQQLGYSPVEIHEDITDHDEFEMIITLFKKKMKKDPPASVVVAIMSHGEGDKLNLTEGDDIDKWDDLVYKFDSKQCPQLQGVPKIFIIQACQGRTGEDRKMPEQPKRDPQVADTLVCFSTIPKYVSHRDRWVGCWYIYCLTKVFMENAHRMDIIDMLDEVQRQLKDAKNEKRITPVCTYNKFLFLKKFYFNPMKPTN